MSLNSRFSIKVFFVFAVIYLGSAISAFGQFETATVLGTVADANQAAVPNAVVTLTNKATGIAQTSNTDAAGDYKFVNVKIGVYSIAVEASGFNKTVAESVNVEVNAKQRVDLTLQVASATETVVITDAANPLQTDSSDLGQVVRRDQIVSLPLNGRSYANLALLSPGVRESNTNSSIGGGGREAAFNVNGLRATMNNFLLDGVDNNAYGTSNQSFSSQVVQVSPDAVAEFKVQTNTYSAEFGRSGGAVINASYRTGTNAIHGTLWEFNRNTALNATGFFKPVGGAKPPLNRNQFGFTVGGPILKDRTFYFGDYEGFRQIQKNLVYSFLPTLAQRQGLLSVAVRNPLTGITYAAGTQIPMTPFAQRVLTELPAPNLTGVTGSNYQESVLNRNNSDKVNVRIDHKISDSFNIFGRWSYRRVKAFEAPNIPGPSGSNQNGFVDILNEQYVVGSTYTFKNASVVDVRFAHSKINAGKRPPLAGGQSMFELYGITGLPSDNSVTGGLTTQSISGFSQIGRQSTNPQFQNPINWNLRTGYTRLFGRQTLKFGYEYLRVNTEVQDTNPLMGIDTYSAQFSRPTSATSNNLYNLADFIFGLRNQYALANLTVAQMRQRFHYAYVQDDVKINRKLTVNLGLRYEFGTPYFEQKDQLSNYDPVSNSIVLASGGSLSKRALVDPDFNNFGPRIGFAYNVFAKTVVRGGYGVGYNFLNRLGSADILGTNYPIITRAAVAQNTRIASPLCVGDVYQNNCFRPTQSGYPTSDLPNNVTLYVPRDIKTPMIQNWQLSIQQELPWNLTVDLAYVGNKAKNLVILADYNQARPVTEAESLLPASLQPSLQARRPIQGFGTISGVLPLGFSEYNALQFKVERRFAQGLYFLNSFSWSKAIDNASQVLEEPSGNTGTPQNLYDMASNKGIGAYDQPFNNTTGFVFELPFGRGKKFGGSINKIVDAFAGGWTLSGINTMTSGQPITFRYGPSPVTNNLPSFLGGVALRPNLVCDPTNHAERSNPTRNYFIRTCLTTPTAYSPFGNAGRNIARSDSYFNLDFAIQKQFALPITEYTKLGLRFEMFNALNKTNFGAANSDINSSAFGTISSTFPARQIQIALKAEF